MKNRCLDIKVVGGNIRTDKHKPNEYLMTFEVFFALDEETFTNYKAEGKFYDWSLNEEDFINLIKNRI